MRPPLPGRPCRPRIRASPGPEHGHAFDRAQLLGRRSNLQTDSSSSRCRLCCSSSPESARDLCPTACSDGPSRSGEPTRRTSCTRTEPMPTASSSTCACSSAHGSPCGESSRTSAETTLERPSHFGSSSLLLLSRLLSWVVLLPVDAVGSASGRTGLDRFTFGNVDQNSQKRYAAHLLMVWIFNCEPKKPRLKPARVASADHEATRQSGFCTTFARSSRTGSRSVRGTSSARNTRSSLRPGPS